MNAREQILADVRTALQGAPRPEPVPAVPRPVDPLDGLALVDLFCERVADYRATVVRCAADEVEERIAEALPVDCRTVVPAGLPWSVRGSRTDDDLSAQELDTLDAVVTAATAGIAETGTLVLTHGVGEGRRALSLVPDRHVCVVRASQLVADVPDVLGLLDPGRPTTWISGPSATSDIELQRVEGVHGPRTLWVIVVDTG